MARAQSSLVSVGVYSFLLVTVISLVAGNVYVDTEAGNSSLKGSEMNDSNGNDNQSEESKKGEEFLGNDIHVMGINRTNQETVFTNKSINIQHANFEATVNSSINQSNTSIWEDKHLSMSHGRSNMFEKIRKSALHGVQDDGIQHFHQEAIQRHQSAGREYVLNQFIYELKTIRCCFFQFVGKGNILTILYQNMNTDPVSIHIFDPRDKLLHQLADEQATFVINVSVEGPYQICLENFSWNTKKVFLSLCVEHSPVQNVSNEIFHKTEIWGITNRLDVLLRAVYAELLFNRARLTSRNNFADDTNSLIIWLGRFILVVALVTYILQVMEIHRIFNNAEEKTTFSMNGGELKIAKGRENVVGKQTFAFM